MKAPYCTCEKHSKEVFSTGFVIFGVIWQTIVSVVILGFLFLESFEPILLIVLLLLWLWMAWEKFEFKRQALFLGHNIKCAKRYSTLGMLTNFRGNYPAYEKITGYKSAIRALAERLLGKKRANRTFRNLTITGWLVSAFLIGLLTYDGLTRQRNGLPNETTKYSPGLSESMWAAFGLSILAAFAYYHLGKKTNRKKLLATSIASGTLLAWLGIVYAVSWYARMDPWENIGVTILVLVIVAVIVSVAMVIEKLWQKRKTKAHRRRHNIALAAKHGH